MVDEYGNGIYQVSVTLAHETGPRQVLTDKEGRFTFTLRQGHYALRLEKEGFVTTKDALTVPQSNGTTTDPNATGECLPPAGSFAGVC